MLKCASRRQAPSNDRRGPGYAKSILGGSEERCLAANGNGLLPEEAVKVFALTVLTQVRNISSLTRSPAARSRYSWPRQGFSGRRREPAGVEKKDPAPGRAFMRAERSHASPSDGRAQMRVE